MGEDVVIIPIQVEVQDSESTSAYLTKLKQHLESIRNMMAADPKGNDLLKNMQSRAKETIQRVEELEQKLSETMANAADSDAGTKEMFKLYNEMKRGVGEYQNVTQQQIDMQKKMWESMKRANVEEQADAQRTADVVTSEINKEIKALNELAVSYMITAKNAKEFGKLITTQAKVMDADAQTMSNKLNTTGKPTNALAAMQAKKMEEEAAKAAEERAAAEEKAAKEAEKATQKQIASLNREKTAVRETAAQYYYKLRSIKMLGFTISSINSKIDSFGKNMFNGAKKALGAYLKLVPGVNALGKAVSKAATSQRKFNKEVNATTKSHGDFNESLGHAVKNLLRYGFGIRSLFVLFNRLRQTMIDGLGQLSQKYSEVNQQMSSVVSSMNQMKAAVTSVVQPLLNVLAPALEKIAAVVADIAYKVASFIAALTGQSFVFKATRQQVDYAKSLDKTAKSAKEATKELGKYDKLNVIHKDDKGGSDDGGVGAMGFEKVPIDSTMADWAKKFKDFLNRLFAPIKKAWEKWKNFVIAGWKYAGRELLKLAKDIARDFWRVWEEPETQLIFENIFHTLGNIGYIVGNLARNFREAWNEAENGYRILKSIRDIFLILSDALVRISTYMTAWSDQLSFIPLLHTLADVMEQQLVPAVQKVVDLFVYLFDEIILKIVKDFIEKGLPQALRIAGNLVEAIGNIAENLRIALEDSDRGVQIVEKIEGLIGIVADHIESASEKTKEWAENLNFIPLLDAISKFLDDVEPLVTFIADTLERLWTNTLLPFWKYLVEDGFPKLLDVLGNIANNIDWDKLTENMQKLVDALEPIFEFAWEVLLQIIEDLGKAFGDFLNSDTFSDIVQNVKDFADSLKEMTEEERAQKIQEFAKSIEDLAGKIIGFKAALSLTDKLILPFVENIMTFQNVANNMSMQKSLGKISKDIGKLTKGAEEGAAAVGAKGLTGALGSEAGGGLAGALGGLAGPILLVVGFLVLLVGAFGGIEGAVKRFKELFQDVADYLKEFAEQADISGSIDKLKESFGKLTEGLEALRPIFEVWFKWIGIKLKSGIGQIIAVFDALMTFLSGVIEFVSGFFNTIKGILKVFVGIFTGNVDKIKEGVTDVYNGVSDMFSGMIDIFTSFGEFIADTFANKIGAIFPSIKDTILGWVKDTKDAIEEWKNKVIEFFGDLKYKLIGDPIVYDIRDGIIEAFKKFVDDTWKSVQTWVKNIITKFTEFGREILNSIKTTWRNMISETQRSWSTFKSNISKYARESINKFKTEFGPTKLVSIGKNFIGGLISGIQQKASSLVSTISTVCGDAVNAVRNAFQIHSPSRVMMEIGRFIVEGLAVGVEDESDKDLIPLDFIQPFLDALNDMRSSAVYIMSSMVDEIEAVMASLEFANMMNNMYAQLDNIKSIQVPNIVSGKQLPTNANFKQSDSKNSDLSRLSDIIREAIEDAVNAINSDSNKEPIMLQLDSRVLAEAVWDEEEKRYKQRGDYRPFYT